MSRTRTERNGQDRRNGRPNVLKARRLHIDTRQEVVVFMRADCPVCRAEGFMTHARVALRHGPRTVIATLYHAPPALLDVGEVGLSESAWTRLGADEGDDVRVAHPPPLESMRAVRGKVYGRRLGEDEFGAILADIVTGRYSEIHLSAFITACSARPLDRREIVALTRAMIDVGDRLRWEQSPVVDKHCVGGLPGNRTTPVVVAIAAACGLIMPKTSSRAITSPAGTADAMETMAPVDLDLRAMRRVVEAEGACIVWGGSVRLSPADDLMIRVERALDLDSEGQLVASVLSKKIAAGATLLVLDLPVGPTAKIRSQEAADMLARDLVEVAAAFGVRTVTLQTDGSQPVGRGIGPALEARDVLAVLRNAPDAPDDLRTRAVALAGLLLELAGVAAPGAGAQTAGAVLADGRAGAKFERICEAQGGLRTPPQAAFRKEVRADRSGPVTGFDNRRLAMVAKLAGAPLARSAGLELAVRLGDEIAAGQRLYTIHAESPGEIDYAYSYATANGDIIALGET